MAQFKTLQFPNTPSGQRDKIRALEQASSQGWIVVSETITPGKFNGGQACCNFLVCAPCAFLAGHHDDIITITLNKQDSSSKRSAGLPELSVTLEDNTIKCPYCAEEIKEAAIVCKFCKRDLPAKSPKQIRKRVLCPDGNCTGIVGENGTCNKCGRHYRTNAM